MIEQILSLYKAYSRRAYLRSAVIMLFAVLAACGSSSGTASSSSAGGSATFAPTATDTFVPPTATDILPTPTDTAVPPPPTQVVPPTATSFPEHTVLYGYYSVIISGTAGGNSFQQNGTVVILPQKESHPFDVCFFTGSQADYAANPDVGKIAFSSNSACFLDGGPGATAAVDYTFVQGNGANGTVTVSADPTKCCNYNLSTNGFTISSGILATPYSIGQGGMKLQFSGRGQDVAGNIDVSGCTINPYCTGVEYIASITGNFAHS